MSVDFQPVLLARGATGIVYQLNDFIALKRARKGEDEEADHANEQRVFEFLERRLPIPYLIRCIYREPHFTFLEFAANGSLAMLLNRFQTRDKETGYTRVLAVSQTFPMEDIHRWMWQLCSAAVGFEEAGIVHGDLRPGNLLFNSAWDLLVGDLDRSVKIDDDLIAVSEPFGRLLSKSDGESAGTYGKAGVRTETFAIGSIYYTLLRGHEPYEIEYWGEDHGCVMIDKFQNKEFPPLTDSMEDAIIHRCWEGKYQSAKELLAEFVDDPEKNALPAQDREWLVERRSQCVRFLNEARQVTNTSFWQDN